MLRDKDGNYWYYWGSQIMTSTPLAGHGRKATREREARKHRVRIFWVPDIKDPKAPTRRELEAGVELFAVGVKSFPPKVGDEVTIYNFKEEA